MWSKMIQRLLNEENLLIGISELSEIAEVSPRQLRYWEEKGYISSNVIPVLPIPVSISR